MVEATTDREEVRLSVSRSLCPEAGLGCRDSCMAGPRLGVSTRDTNGIYRQTEGTAGTISQKMYKAIILGGPV